MGGAQGNFVFGGRAEVNFSSYALNGDELKKFEQKFEDSDVDDVLKLIDGATEESLGQLKKELMNF